MAIEASTSPAARAARADPAGPPADDHRDSPTPLAAYLRRSHERWRRAADGAIATYIPELGRADPAWFGIAAVTLDGRLIEVGDSRVPFSIQSISKPLVYGLILDDLGESAVRARIGVEPTGDAFNAITLAPGTGLPLNPMVNAGAITAASLVRPAGGRSPLERLLDGFGRFAGRPLQIDEAVFASERDTGHRNRAIANLLKANGAIDGEPNDVVETYFAQCSVLITTADLAVIAATLANGGMNPLTGERAISAAAAQGVLSVMATCGMYDGAGEWLYSVGIPAKSGVSGGILAVIPGQLGIATFSPPLDANGNSVRGVRVCRDIVDGLGLHPHRYHGPSASAIRTTFAACEVGSKRQRTDAERRILDARGPRGLIVELQGHLTFLAADEIAWAIRTAHDAADGGLDAVVLDAGHVDGVDPAAADLLGELIAGLSRDGIEVVLSGRHRVGAAVGRIESAVSQRAGGPLQTCDDLDSALEAVENLLLGGDAADASAAVPLDRHDIVRGLDEAGLAALSARLDRRAMERGARIVERGAPARELFLIERGRASVTVDSIDGRGGRRRLSTLGAGQAFGESALFDGGLRTADVVADSDVELLVLTVDAFEALLASHPTVAMTLLRNLLSSANATAGRLSREVAALSA